jgi:hypothetical protein
MVPGAPDPVIDQAVVDAARELCRTTNGWRYELESSDLSKEGSLVVMSAPENTVLLRPYSVSYGDNGALAPMSREKLTRLNSRWRSDVGDPSFYVFVAPDKLLLTPWPTTLVMRDLIVTVSLMPALGVTEIDDHLATRFSEHIRNGALARLFMMPKRSWSDPQLGAAHLALFAMAMASIEEEGTDSGVRNLPRSVRYGGY